MAKISPVSIKYLVHAKFIAEGRLEKPDVIGAIFGQTEGLLGSDLEMRELQKEGKIGRIDVDVSYENSKTIGKIHIPSALDKAETTIIAAAIETIERIGPSDSKIEIEQIEDVRGNKRDYIINRAKKLLEQIQGSVPESRDITDSIKESAKLSKLTEYGKEKLPAGDISGEEVIVVEGRADVINLLKNNVTNVIAMNGTKLPEGVKELSKEKKIVLFVDGDRGGKLIVKNVISNAEIDSVAYAPDGKEVEELTGKEILYALRKKVEVRDLNTSYTRTSYRKTNDIRNSNREDRTRNKSYSRTNRNERNYEPPKLEKIKKRNLTSKEMEKLEKLSKSIEKEKVALILDENLDKIDKVSVSGISNKLMRIRKAPFVLVIDGIANLGIIKSAERREIQHIVAKNFAPIETEINMISM